MRRSSSRVGRVCTFMEDTSIEVGMTQSSSGAGGPFSRSLSTVMECINIGEPAGANGPTQCSLRLLVVARSFVPSHSVRAAVDRMLPTGHGIFV